MTKYKAKPVYYDPVRGLIIQPIEARQLDKTSLDKLIYFASKHEYKVYRELLNFPGITGIKLQPSIPIIPANTLDCYPNGKAWKADFSITFSSRTELIVEAKGVMTKDFLLTLALLETYNKEAFNKLWLIFPSKHPSNLVVKNLKKTEMNNRIYSLGQFKENLSVTNTF